MLDLQRLRSFVLGLALCLPWAAGALAQGDAAGFPKQPIKLMVGLAPGAINDIQARVIAQKLSERLGQPVVVENKTGAGGNIAAEYVAHAPADGYTLLCAPTSTLTVNPAVYAKLNYDPQKDFVPITQLSSYQLYLTINAELPVKTLPELIAYAKAHPELANMGSPSTVFELITALFAERTGTKFVTIPFKSTAETMTALLTKQVMITWQDYNSLNQQLRSGKVRVLATTGKARSSDMPDTPTLAEAGYPGVELEPLTGIVAPKATPPAIVAKLQSEIQETLKAPEVAERWRSLTMKPVGNSSAEFAALIDSEIKRWTAVAKAANIKLEQ